MQQRTSVESRALEPQAGEKSEGLWHTAFEIYNFHVVLCPF